MMNRFSTPKDDEVNVAAGVAPREHLAGRLCGIRHVALDLDGTVYKDDVLFDGVNEFLALLRNLDIGYTFLTNNSSRSRREYVARLRGMGLDVDEENIFTSADATIAYLRKDLPEVRRLFLLGTPSLDEQFVEAGYTLCTGAAPGEKESDSSDANVKRPLCRSDAEPEAVVVAFDTTLEYRRLCRAAYWISRGKPYVATHPDRVCPTREPTVLVDCGSLCAALRAATGREPQAVPGKPGRLMLEGIMSRFSLRPHVLTMIGDRLYTDMAMAADVGALSVLVLTGEATAQQAAACENPPDLVVENLAAFGRMLKESRKGTA
jgi:HAD superfamily hydrolase (TIGR01450 family)